MRKAIIIEAAGVCLIFLGGLTASSQEAVHLLPGWQAQRDGFQKYRDEQQRELDFDRRALDRAREAADVPAKEKAFKEATKEVFKGSGEALKNAFKDAVQGKVSWGVAKDTFDRAMNVAKQQNAGGNWLQSAADKERLDAKIDALTQEIATHEKNIAISNQIIAISDNEIAKLESTSKASSQNMTGLFQQAANAFVGAAARQSARRAEEARQAEQARQAQARNSGPPNHPTHGDMDDGRGGGNGGGGGGGGGRGGSGGGHVIDMSPGSTITADKPDKPDKD